MNKKFFTLIASVFMLAASLGTGNAQGIVHGQGIARGTAIGSLPQSADQKYLYQLGVNVGHTQPLPAVQTTHLLYMNSGSELSFAEWANYDYRDLAHGQGSYAQTLWCISFGQWDFDGSYPAGLQFLNTQYQKYLMANEKDSKQIRTTDPVLNPDGLQAKVNVNDGNLSVWGMSLVFNQNIQQRMPIYSYFTNDSVVVLLYNESGPETVVPLGISTARIAADDLFTGIYSTGVYRGANSKNTGGFRNQYRPNGDAGVKGGGISDYLVWVTVMRPQQYILNANDFNTAMNPYLRSGDLDSRAFRTISFTDQPLNVSQKNPWESYNLRAHDVYPGRIAALNSEFADAIAGNYIPGDGAHHSALAALHSANTADYWVAFELERSLDYNKPNDVWLRVDTAYTDIRTQYLTFNWGKTPARNFTPSLPWANDNKNNLITNPWITGGIANNVFNADPTVAGYNNQFIEGQYYFRLTYDPYNDNLSIDVAQARYVSKDPAVSKNKKWFDERSYLPPAKDFYSNATGDILNAANGIPGYVRRTWGGYADGAGGYSGLTSNPLLNPTELSGAQLANGWKDADYLHIGLVDIDDNKTRLFTVHTPPVYAYAKLGVQGCTILGAITIPEGLYVIGYGEAGSKVYLGVPINTDTLNWSASRYPSGLLTLHGTQDPQKMPSYQWIVKHTSKSATSPVKIINREYPNIVYDYVQLLDKDRLSNAPGVRASWFTLVTKENKDNQFLGYFHADRKDLSLNTYAFNYMHALSNKKYLGRGANTTSSGDNGIKVDDTKEEWRLEPVYYWKNDEKIYDAVPYGYTPTAEDGTKFGVQLKRNAYTIRYAENNFILHIDEQRIYTTAGMPWGMGDDESHINGFKNIYGDGGTTALRTGIQDFGVFLLKTHNTDAKNVDYYALLDTNSYFGRTNSWYKTGDVIYNHVGDPDYVANKNLYYPYDYTTGIARKLSYTKLGLTDASIVAYAQVQKEERTSSFSVEPYALPIYRRFDGGEYLYGNEDKTTKEKEGDESNSPVWLKFHSVPLKDNYLFENSNKNLEQNMRTGLVNKEISSLGVQDIIHYPELYKAGKEGDNVINYAFYVDTAYSKRDAVGKASKPYTPMPQYMLALRPDILKGGKVWYREGSSIWYEEPEDAGDLNTGDSQYGDLKEKILPAMVRGMYLFNAIDSINTNAAGVDYLGHKLDFIPNDVRIAFVDGVHLGDTFYVLRDKDKNVSSALIQREYEMYLYSLPKIRKHYLGDNTHFVPRYVPYSNHPSDAGKNTWVLDKGLGYDKNNEVILQNGKSMVFQFRLRPTRNNIPNEARDFLIETENIRHYINDGWAPNGRKNDNGAILGSRYHRISEYFGTKAVDNDYEIAPNSALYLNSHNGAMVRGEIYSVYSQTTINDAGMGFNVVRADDKQGATSAEATYVNGAQVIGNTGSVSVLNAAGKTVTVTNVLGQTIAKTVAASDNATIALPKGIVVVSVDGKSTKAVVK